MEHSEKEASYSEYNDNFKYHPYNVMLFMVLAIITALFMAISVAFIYTRIQSGVAAINIPILFVFNTFILLACSYAMHRARAAYRSDDTAAYHNMLKLTIWLTFFFLAMQLLAWYQLFSRNIFVQTDNAAGYLYVLSFLHFAHVIAGLPFLMLFFSAAKRLMIEPVSELAYFSDPEKRLRLRLLSIYWHFLDALWIFLVLFLFANQLATP